jgi:hypothetical protein
MGEYDLLTLKKAIPESYFKSNPLTSMIYVLGDVSFVAFVYATWFYLEAHHNLLWKLSLPFYWVIQGISHYES